jgi:hypothetical protein
MTYVMTDHLAHRKPLHDPTQPGEIFDDTARAVLPHGGSGQSLWIGPAGAENALRTNIDAEHAAVTWLADDTTGIELEPGPSVTVMWSVDEPLATVPGTLARVSTQTARRAVLEYVTTGKRPTCLQRATEPQPATR